MVSALGTIPTLAFEGLGFLAGMEEEGVEARELVRDVEVEGFGDDSSSSSSSLSKDSLVAFAAFAFLGFFLKGRVVGSLGVRVLFWGH